MGSVGCYKILIQISQSKGEEKGKGRENRRKTRTTIRRFAVSEVQPSEEHVGQSQLQQGLLSMPRLSDMAWQPQIHRVGVLFLAGHDCLP